MRQLSDILADKIKQLGGKAALGRALGGIPGQTIFQYAEKGINPSIDFAIKWKEAFNENLIDLMLEQHSEEAQMIVSEPGAEYYKEVIKGMQDHIISQEVIMVELLEKVNKIEKHLRVKEVKS